MLCTQVKGWPLDIHEAMGKAEELGHLLPVLHGLDGK